MTEVEPRELELWSPQEGGMWIHEGLGWGSCLGELPEGAPWTLSLLAVLMQHSDYWAPPSPPPAVPSAQYLHKWAQCYQLGELWGPQEPLPLWDFLALPLKKLAFSSPALASLLHEAGHDSLCQWLFESTFSTYLGPHDSREALWNLRLLSPSKGLKEARLRMAVPWEPAQMMSEADVLCCAQTLQLCPTLRPHGL